MLGQPAVTIILINFWELNMLGKLSSAMTMAFTMSVGLFATSLAPVALSKDASKDAVVPAPVATIEAAFSVRQSKSSAFAGLAFGAVSDDLPAMLFATEPSTNKLLRMDAGTGKLSSETGGPGSAIGEFDNPGSVALVGSRVYVLDRGNRRVQIFDGVTLQPEAFAFGSEQLKEPLAILVDDPSDPTVTVDVVDLEAGELYLQRFQLNQEIKAKDGKRTVLLSTTGQQRSKLGKASSGAVSMVRDSGNARYWVIQSGNFWEIDESGKGTAFSLPNLPTFANSTAVGMYACGKANRGYLIIADSSSRTDRLVFLDRTSFAPVASVQLKGISNLTSLTVSREPVAYMSFGAIYAVNNGQSVAALNWDTIAQGAGLMRLCMSG